MIYLNDQPLNVTVFPDNTSQVWKLPEDAFCRQKYHIKWSFSSESEIMHLAQLVSLIRIKCFFTPTIVLELTYLPYGRQDKEISNTSTFALRTFATMINNMNLDEIIIHDPHSEVALKLIWKSTAVYPKTQIQNIILDHNITLACYPDKGAVTKYTKVYKEEIGAAYIYGEKVRDQLTGNITGYKLVGGCNGENVLIIDDICDGGATFKLLAKDLLAAGAKQVNLFVTHGIFSKGIRTICESGISHIFTEDGEVV